MTDAEVICEFMERKPKFSTDHGHISEGSWWWMGSKEWLPSILTLDALHEVEARLTQPQKQHYMSHLASLNGLVGKFYEDAWVYLHATAEQKIATLAIVLRVALASVLRGGNEA